MGHHFMGGKIIDSAKAWAQPNAVRHYAEHRHEPTDLYPSERVFLPRVLFPGAKVLDVGCASGGFFNIMRSMEPLIYYTGIDISEPSIELAKQKYPDARFLIADGLQIPFDAGEFDLVHCTSVLVNDSRHHEWLSELYRVTNRFVIVDIRLLKGASNRIDLKSAYYRVEYDGQDKGIQVPYVVADADEIVNFMLSLDPPPRAVRGTGYFHTVSSLASITVPEVCMSMFLIQKGVDDLRTTEVDLKDLPIDFDLDGNGS